jgi:NAD(P)-dependent dehydrogenase (short-subunit alcohol dehydrogenase family)
MELTDKVIVVTGGANGIGAAMCRRFAAEGARGIVVADLDADTAATVAAEVGGIAMRTDVASEADVRSMIEVTEETYGPVDVLCLNAGIPTGGSVDAPNDAWQRAWDVNVMSHVYAVRAVLPSMLARGEGYLVHTASAAGLLTNLGAAPYSVTKHAVIALAEWLSVTYGDAGIRVSALCPQFVQTGMLDSLTEVGAGFHEMAVATSISTEEVAATVVEGIRDERFLILPHPEVAGYFANKANDYERWLGGMRRLQRRVDAGPA